MSADSGNTNSPGSPPASAPEKAARKLPAARSAKPIRSLTEREKERAEKRAAKPKNYLINREIRASLKKIDRLEKEALADKLTDLADTITERGLHYARGLLVDAQRSDGTANPDYNADALVPTPDMTTRTKFAIDVYKTFEARRRENQATVRALGVVVLQSRLNEADWNEEARRVDEEQRRKQAIDVAAEMLKDDANTDPSK